MMSGRNTKVLNCDIVVKLAGGWISGGVGLERVFIVALLF